MRPIFLFLVLSAWQEVLKAEEVCLTVTLYAQKWNQCTGTGCTSYRENEYAWTLGSCSSDWYKRGVGTEANVYEEECCIEPGLQTLTCLDGTGDGWSETGSPGSSVVIEGESYCDDFKDGASYTVDVIINAGTSYYVDDGCHSEGNTPDDVTGFYQSQALDAYVRCCSDDATSCTTVSDCQKTVDVVNYDDAVAECTSIGMRLCTKDELLTEVCCGTGGQCDSHAVWTSTPYVESSYYVDDGCHSENSSPDDYAGFYQIESSLAYVRCCSDDGSTCQTISNCGNSGQLRSYYQAEEECAAVGKRLCTMEELLTDICCGTGGGCDSDLVWTSTVLSD